MMHIFVPVQVLLWIKEKALRDNPERLCFYGCQFTPGKNRSQEDAKILLRIGENAEKIIKKIKKYAKLYGGTYQALREGSIDTRIPVS